MLPFFKRKQKQIRSALWPKLTGSALALALTAAQPAWAQSRPVITGISYMELYADDSPASQQFYSSILGWKPVPPAGPGGGMRFYANHEQYIELLRAPHPGMANRLAAFGFLTADAEAMRHYLATQAVRVPAAVTMQPNGDRTFTVRDPEGNQVGFTQLSSHPVAAPQNPGQRLSTHIIHLGFVAHDRKLLDSFYHNILGLHLYWQGEPKPGPPDWVMMQVPNGTDWIEYMLYLPDHPSRQQLGSANHFSPGVVDTHELQRRLQSRPVKPANQERGPLLGVDGKWQLDLLDPDGTRVEFMEFNTAKTPCCASFTGPEPGPLPGW